VENIRVIQYGLGSVGKAITKVLSQKRGVTIVGAVDVAEDLVGKDVGRAAGIGTELGVLVTNDPDSLFSHVSADVVIHTTSPAQLNQSGLEMIKPLEESMNVITASMQLTDPYLYDSEVAARLDEVAKRRGVTIVGMGSIQTTERFILAFTEQCSEIQRITFTHHADITPFAPESYRKEFGIGYSLQEYERRVKEGSILEHRELGKEVIVISRLLGWQLDGLNHSVEKLTKDHLIFGVKFLFQGCQGREIKTEMIWEFLLDPEHRYYQRVEIDGLPSINAMINYSADRGLQGTVGPIVNAIPHVLIAQPGLLKLYHLPACFAKLADLRTALS
jgi:hypothetical protein